MTGPFADVHVFSIVHIAGLASRARAMKVYPMLIAI